MKIEINSIGKVINSINEPIAPALIKEHISIIEIDEQYIKGLKDISSCEYIDIVFYFHCNDEIKMIINSKRIKDKGVFATRAPSRPNHIGVTTVQLIKVEANRLHVKGLDAINNSPVLDIKCCDTSLHDIEKVHNSILAENPRIDIERCIKSTNRDDLLYKAGQLHGHICPGIAMGVLCGAEVMKMIFDKNEDPFDYAMTAQQPNCVLDGLMFVTGFKKGKKKKNIEHREQMVERNCKNERTERITLSADHKGETIKQQRPNAMTKLESSYKGVKLDFNRIFDVEEIS